MLLFVIFQEPLYRAIKNNSNIIGPNFPNNVNICIQGYADDSSVLISTDQSICEVYSEIQRFELATGAVLNKQKTSIMGIGKWSSRSRWPLNWLVTVECMKILGIYYYNDFKLSIEKNWSEVSRKIETSVNMLGQRQLSLFQKAIIINTVILSKVWYITHTVPVIKSYVLKINANIFRYLWRGSYRPINRNTLCLPRKQGGLGLINVHLKAVAIFTSACLKNIICDIGLSNFYCKMRLSYLVDTKEIETVSLTTPTFYTVAIDCIRKVCRNKGFPLLKSKDIYAIIMPKIKPIVEDSYPLLDWELTWKSVNVSFIGTIEREFVFKYIHGTLATNQRLEMLKLRTNGRCERCGESEYIMHLVYFCNFIRPTLRYFQNTLLETCNIKNDRFLNTLLFNFVYKTKKEFNTAVILIVGYLYVVWVSKKHEYTKEETLEFVKSIFHYDRWILNMSLKDNVKTLFTKKYIDYRF